MLKRRITYMIISLTLMFFFSFTVLAADERVPGTDSRAYANTVVEKELGGAANINNLDSYIIGVVDMKTMSLGGGYVIVDMGANELILDEEGDDLRVYEKDQIFYGMDTPETYEVFVSQDLQTWKSLGEGTGTAEFDLAGSGLSWARYVKIEDRETSTSGREPGSDIDAIEALHFGEEPKGVISVPSTPGFTLISAIMMFFALLFIRREE
ncbi:MAG: hypothetical protein WBL02_09900 [Methanomethylovorans sp.]|uniref:hypothetical protein n=1 Tax=Methanomethylovorans sp. TaxID=2758717 RepID=UPI001BD2E036|nr:hypothetical protein [Methanomethylovorans sp.]